MRSIWDDDQDDLTDEQREQLERERLSPEEYERLEQEREAIGGWFGGDYADMSDSRWGPKGSRRYVDDPDDPGVPQAQHGFGSPRISRGSRRVDRHGPAAWAWSGKKKYESTKKRYGLFRDNMSKSRRERNDKISGAW
jgi:hypothetical protein